MQTYFFSRVCRFFVVIPLAITTLSYGMMVKQQDAPRFKTKDEISTALPFTAGVLCGAVLPLIAPVMAEIKNYTVEKLHFTMDLWQGVSFCGLLMPVVLTAGGPTMDIHRLEGFLRAAPVRSVGRDKIDKLGKHLWAHGALIQEHDSKYAELCSSYNKLLEKSVKTEAAANGFAVGYFAATLGVIGFRAYTGDFSPATDTLSRMHDTLD
jgi:hypothetical protein